MVRGTSFAGSAHLSGGMGEEECNGKRKGGEVRMIKSRTGDERVREEGRRMRG